MDFFRRHFFVALSIALLFTVLGCETVQPEDETLNWSVSGVFSHDPSVIYADGTYYLFYTANGIGKMSSADGITWRTMRSALTINYSWWKKYVPNKTDQNIWAPNVTQWNGRYYVFYSVSTFGSNTSCIGLLSTDDLSKNDWKDEGLVIASASGDKYNAIDPFFISDGGTPYMAFGSFWQGIFLVELDPETLHKKEGAVPVNIACRPSETAIEGCTIFKEGDWYYLLASYDFCCRGTSSTYNVRYGRSQSISGPYLDEKGIDLTKGGGTRLLSSRGSRIGPGGGEVFKTADGSWAFAFHFYNASANGVAQLAIRDVRFTEDGWLVH